MLKTGGAVTVKKKKGKNDRAEPKEFSGLKSAWGGPCLGWTEWEREGNRTQNLPRQKLTWEEKMAEQRGAEGEGKKKRERWLY